MNILGGSNNTCIGSVSGSITTTGTNNIFLGNSAGLAAHGIAAGDSNKLVIANNTTAASRLLFGDFASNQLGLNTSLPTTATNFDIADTGDTNQPGLTFKRVNANIATNAALGTIDFAGTADNVNSGNDSATPRVGSQILGCAAESWGIGANNSGSDLRFFTTINGGGGAAAFHEMMRISNNGNVGIFHNTTAGFNPIDPDILHVRATNIDCNIKVETVPLGGPNTARVILANIPAGGTTSHSISDPIGAIEVQGHDSGATKKISQINSFLTVGAGNFTSNVEFSMMSADNEVKCMEMRGGDTITGGFSAGFGAGGGLLYRNYTKNVGTSIGIPGQAYQLSDIDSGMHLFASTSVNFVHFSLPGHALNTVQPHAPHAGTHYRFIRNSNDNNIFRINSSDGTPPDLKMFGSVAHGGAAVNAAAVAPFLNPGRGVAPFPNPNVAGNIGISLGNSLETIHGVIGDHIDVMYNGAAWYVSGAMAGTNATGGDTGAGQTGTTIVWF